MKRRLNGGGAGDSLELLLDTLCNIFGGIVLISCLLAILPRQKMPPPLIPAESAKEEMTERRIIKATEEIDRLKSDIEQLSQSTDPKIAELQSRRNSLNELLESLQKNAKDKDDLELNEADIRAIAAKGDPKLLEEKLMELKLQKSKNESKHATTVDKIRYLEQRSKNLTEEAEKLGKEKIQAVRFPRERAAKASPFPIIVRYDRVYPLQVDGGKRSNPDVEMIPIDDAALLTLLKVVETKGYYATVYLYPDSHRVFNDLTQVMGKAGISYGLEFVEAARELNFGSNGSAPPEL
jgi:hypothetical protein